MITNNGMVAMSLLFEQNNSTGVNGTFTLLDGTTNAPNYGESYLNANKGAVTSQSSDGFSMILGNGVTAPSVNDYNLANVLEEGVDINTILVCRSATRAISARGKVTFTYIFENTTNTSHVVREIGLILKTHNYPVLFAREVVPERVITAGETFTFSFSINAD